MVRADVRYYQYDGKLPFVQMMLNMMVAMGVLDRLPSNVMYGSGYGAAYPASPWSGYANPFQRSPWLQSPWMRSAQPGSIWGNPGWGVLPLESYSPYDNGRYGSPWSSSDLNGWVNEPWETSEWNPEAENLSQSSSPSVAPLVQNFNYNVPENIQKSNNQKNNGKNTQSPLAKHAQPRHSVRQPAPQPKKQPPLAKKARQQPRQKPCVTEFCGLKKPNLNGLWVSRNGEMLGIKNHRFLWNDGRSRYLSGQIKIQNEYLLASADGHKQLLRFKYKLAGNHLLTMRPDGKIREFTRMAANRYYGR